MPQDTKLQMSNQCMKFWSVKMLFFAGSLVDIGPRLLRSTPCYPPQMPGCRDGCNGGQLDTTWNYFRRESQWRTPSIWVGLLGTVLIKLIDERRPSPGWVVPLPRQGILELYKSGEINTIASEPKQMSHVPWMAGTTHLQGRLTSPSKAKQGRPDSQVGRHCDLMKGM